MRDEVSFIVLEGVMCAVAVVALNVFHPGVLFGRDMKVEVGGRGKEGSGGESADGVV